MILNLKYQVLKGNEDLLKNHKLYVIVEIGYWIILETLHGICKTTLYDFVKLKK